MHQCYIRAVDSVRKSATQYQRAMEDVVFITKGILTDCSVFVVCLSGRVGTLGTPKEGCLRPGRPETNQTLSLLHIHPVFTLTVKKEI